MARKKEEFTIPNLREITIEYDDSFVIWRYDGKNMNKGPWEVEIVYKEDIEKEEKKKNKRKTPK
jgi:hypothetical protein